MVTPRTSPGKTSKAQAAQGRVTVVQSVYHQIPGQQPTVVDARGTLKIKSDDQPYGRELTVGGLWQRLDHGWLEPGNLSLITLHNREGSNPQVVLSEEEILELEGRGVVLGVNAQEINTVIQVLVVRPGTCIAFCPHCSADRLRIRCLGPSARCSVTLFPG